MCSNELFCSFLCLLSLNFLSLFLSLSCQFLAMKWSSIINYYYYHYYVNSVTINANKLLLSSIIIIIIIIVIVIVVVVVLVKFCQCGIVSELCRCYGNCLVREIIIIIIIIIHFLNFCFKNNNYYENCNFCRSSPSLFMRMG